MRLVSLAATLDEFWAGDILTVTELIDRTGLTGATLHSVCNELIERGWVLERPGVKGRSPRKGRPARRFELNADAGCVLGLDVSEVHLGVIVADLIGNTLFQANFELPYVLNVAERSGHLLETIDGCLRQAGVTRDRLLVASIGIAAPVSVGSNAIGMNEPIETTTELWRGIRLDAELLHADLGDLPVLYANDANLALLGERWRGAARGFDHVVVLLGNEDNVGAAIMDSGRLLYGRSGGAGEMYWLEDLAPGVLGTESIARLALRWSLAEAGDPGSLLSPLPAGTRVADVPATGGAMDAPVMRRVAAGIANTVSPTIRLLSILLNPEVIVLSGAAQQWRDAIVPSINQAIAGDVHDPPRIASSPLGDAVVAVGAVFSALEHIHQNALSITPVHLRAADRTSVQ